MTLFSSLRKDMKAHYGRYSIHFPMAGLIVSQNEEFFRKLKEHLNLENKLSDLIMRFVHIYRIHRMKRSVIFPRPIQRLTQYEMIFQELMQTSQDADNPEEARIYGECIKIANDISQTTNAMVKAGRIEDFDGDVTKQGELIIEEEAEMIQTSKKQTLFKTREKTERIQIFLFTQSVIVCSIRAR